MATVAVRIHPHGSNLVRPGMGHATTSTDAFRHPVPGLRFIRRVWFGRALVDIVARKETQALGPQVRTARASSRGVLILAVLAVWGSLQDTDIARSEVSVRGRNRRHDRGVDDRQAAHPVQVTTHS
jgi:hypothetical protein